MHCNSKSVGFTANNKLNNKMNNSFSCFAYFLADMHIGSKANTFTIAVHITTDNTAQYEVILDNEL